MSAYRQEKALSGDAFSHVLGGRDETIVVAVHMRVLHYLFTDQLYSCGEVRQRSGCGKQGFVKGGDVAPLKLESD